MTLQCRILRRSCSMIKKQYSTRSVTVGSEEIQGGNHLTVILQKGQPLLIRVSAAYDATQIAGHGPFGDDKSKLLQFRVDLGSTPIGILFGQPGDQIPDFLSDPRPTARRSGTPVPVETKAGAMPSDDGFWFDNEKHIRPAGPEATESGPEEPVAVACV